MVGSQLNCTATAHALALVSRYCDVDGPLLVDDGGAFSASPGGSAATPPGGLCWATQPAAAWQSKTSGAVHGSVWINAEAGLGVTHRVSAA